MTVTENTGPYPCQRAETPPLIYSELPAHRIQAHRSVKTAFLLRDNDSIADWTIWCSNAVVAFVFGLKVDSEDNRLAAEENQLTPQRHRNATSICPLSSSPASQSFIDTLIPFVYGLGIKLFWEQLQAAINGGSGPSSTTTKSATYFEWPREVAIQILLPTTAAEPPLVHYSTQGTQGNEIIRIIIC
jgi:hypothetical protein